MSWAARSSWRQSSPDLTMTGRRAQPARLPWGLICCTRAHFSANLCTKRPCLRAGRVGDLMSRGRAALRPLDLQPLAVALPDSGLRHVHTAVHSVLRSGSRLCSNGQDYCHAVQSLAVQRQMMPISRQAFPPSPRAHRSPCTALAASWERPAAAAALASGVSGSSEAGALGDTRADTGPDASSEASCRGRSTMSLG